MFCLVLITCVTVSQAYYGPEYYAEWQTGVDKTINKQSEFTTPQFPIRKYTQITFPRRFSARPQVLLMHDEIQWSKGRNINYQTYVSDITINGFYINYVIWGPAVIPILSVRWVAIVDDYAEVQYVHYQYEDLFYLREGFGQRSQDFMISYYPRYPAPKVTSFIVGADIEIYESLFTSVQIQMGIPSSNSMDVRFTTRDFCHVRSLLVAYFISNNYLTMAGSVGAYHNFYNQFIDNTNQQIIRAQKFTRTVPSIYSLEPASNVLAQGISGFDIHAYAGSTYIRVTCEPMIQYTSTYTLIYGTRGETLLSYLQASYVLHPPGAPYHYYYKNYDWIVTKDDQIIFEETIQNEQKINEIKKK